MAALAPSEVLLQVQTPKTPPIRRNTPPAAAGAGAGIAVVRAGAAFIPGVRLHDFERGVLPLLDVPSLLCVAGTCVRGQRLVGGADGVWQDRAVAARQRIYELFPVTAAADAPLAPIHWLLRPAKVVADRVGFTSTWQETAIEAHLALQMFAFQSASSRGAGAAAETVPLHVTIGVFGDSAVGKTALFSRWTTGRFLDLSYDPDKRHHRTVSVGCRGRVFQCRLVDAPHSSALEATYPTGGLDAALLLYDVSSPETEALRPAVDLHALLTGAHGHSFFTRPHPRWAAAPPSRPSPLPQSPLSSDGSEPGDLKTPAPALSPYAALHSGGEHAYRDGGEAELATIAALRAVGARPHPPPIVLCGNKRDLRTITPRAFRARLSTACGLPPDLVRCVAAYFAAGAADGSDAVGPGSGSGDDGGKDTAAGRHAPCSTSAGVRLARNRTYGWGVPFAEMSVRTCENVVLAAYLAVYTAVRHKYGPGALPPPAPDATECCAIL